MLTLFSSTQGYESEPFNVYVLGSSEGRLLLFKVMIGFPGEYKLH